MALSKIDTAAIATDAIEAAQLKSDAVTAGDLPANTVLKIYRDTATTQVQPSTTVYSDIGLEITLTPRDANSKFLLQGEIFWLDGGGSGWHGGNYRFVRGSTTVHVPAYSLSLGAINGSTSFFHRNMVTYLDSPATASSITYKVQVYNYDTNVYWCYGTGPSNFTIYEIAG